MLTCDKNCLIAKNAHEDLHLLPQMSNRHGLITGATGSGKTVTLQTISETFSQIGVPVFLADVKGDLSGIAAPSEPKGKIASRILDLGLEKLGFKTQGFPVTFFDVFGKSGHPLRATISDMGPLLLSRILNLNEVQSSLMHLVFRVADDQGLLLLDLKDLRAMLKHVSENKELYEETYGNISKASVGVIQRALLRLEEEGGDIFFGEPSLNLDDLLQTDENGRGVISILDCQILINSPLLYSTLLLWLLSQLYEKLPEQGDTNKPRLVFFFDEAHLLFDGISDVLLKKIEQVVRLIRSKGVGIYFVSQNPTDIPDSILGQLGNRVQHALRAFTPKDQKTVKAAAQSFRPNEKFSTEKVIDELGVGEALVSFLNDNGAPAVVSRAFILPPQSRVGPLSDSERLSFLQNSLLKDVYDTPLDRESAYEILKKRTEEILVQEKQSKAQDQNKKIEQDRQKQEEKERLRQEMQVAREKARTRQRMVNAISKQAEKSFSSPIGKFIGGTLVRGILGGIFGGR